VGWRHLFRIGVRSTRLALLVPPLPDVLLEAIPLRFLGVLVFLAGVTMFAARSPLLIAGLFFFTVSAALRCGVPSR
jgi:hypothetical protein